jgi:O-antigen/teichoic acid export membrane protein
MVRLGTLLSHWLGARDSDDLRRKRIAAILNGLFTSLGNRLLSVLIGFVSVPLTIGYLGTERYGAWITIGAILAWVGLTDLGLANGLSNAVTSDASRDRPDRVRMHVSNFLLLMALLCAATAVLAFCLWPFIAWHSVYGISDPTVLAEVRTGTAIALALFLLRLPMAAANRVYIAYQEGHVGNFWGAAGNVLTLAALVAVTRTEGGLPLLVLALAGTPLLVDAASMTWLFGFHRPDLRPHPAAVDRSGFGEIMKVGTQFFLIQIMALVTFQTDVLVIAHFLGATRVPTYNLAYQLFNYATLPQALMFPYLWSAYNEAITRGDIAWVRRALRWNILGGLAWSGVAVAGLILIAKPFIGWWAGKEFIPSTTLIWLMAAWVLLNAVTNSVACLLAAASHLRNQLIYSAVSTVSNLGLSILLVTRMGPEGVIAATVLSYSLFVLGPTLVDSGLLIRRLERRAALGPSATAPA